MKLIVKLCGEAADITNPLQRLQTQTSSRLIQTHFSFSGDTNSITMQSVEPLPDSDEDQIPEDLGKLTKVDKARIGRVRLIFDIFALET